MTTSTAVDFADVLDVLNFSPDEFVSIGYYIGDGSAFPTAVGTPAGAPSYIAGLPADANVFYGINPTKGPARRNAGRGTEDKVTRLAALPLDLDIQPDKCATRDVADAIIAELSILLDVRPVVTVDSGHGVHAVWAISDGEIVNGDVGPKRALLKRWGRLVDHVAARHNAVVDGIWDLPRMLRVPYTTNNKSSTAPVVVVAHADQGRPLSMAEVRERLDEYGIVERPEDSQAVSTEVVSPPEDWVPADTTCNYAARMLDGWPTDSPRNGARNPFVYGLHIRLFCALRYGCLTEFDYRRGCKILADRLTELVTTTGTPRKVRKYEIADMIKHGMAKVSAKTNEQVAAELGDHHRQEVTTNASPGDDEPAPTTWEPVDPGPWLDGTAVIPTPTLGIARSDGVQFIYPGCEHAVLGETESGKTWFALGCVVAALMAGDTVLYIHYEEGDPGSTYERLQLLGVPADMIRRQLVFIAPGRSPHNEWIAALCDPPPTLVVHDGVNECMSLIGVDMDTDGVSEFRRRLVTPFRKIGAATIACDHLPMNPAPGRRDAYGSVHKGAALDGARIQLENAEPFGREMRGVSHVFVTKDRPGYLRTKGRATKVPGKTYMGTLVVDDMTAGPDFMMRIWAPKDRDAVADTAEALADSIHALVLAETDPTVGSVRALGALVRLSGQRVSHAKVRDAVDELLAEGRLVVVAGPKRRIGYKAAVSAP